MARDRNKMTTQTAEPPHAFPKWLLLVHMSASAPNLEEPQRFDFEELSRPLKELGADPIDRVIIIVQVDTATNVSKRFRLTNDEPTFIDIFPTEKDSLEHFLKDVLTAPVTDADIRRQQALRKAIPGFPTSSWPSKIALVVWGHAAGVGSGLEAPFRGALGGPEGSVVRSIGALPELGLDIVGFDACFMASLELAYEIRECASYMLAPEAGISLEGWHYDQLVDQILAEPTVTPIELCQRVIDQVGLSFTSPETLSLLRLGDQVKALARPLAELGNALFDACDDANREPQMRQWILDAFCEAIWVGARQFLDLGDLCRVLASRIPQRSVRVAALGVISTLTQDPSDDNPVRSTGGSKKEPEPGLVADQLSILDVPLSGISIYCPWPRATQCEVRAGTRNVNVDEDEYSRLKFVCETGWGSLMFDPRILQDAERRWIARETAQEARSIAEEVAGRADGAKPAGRADGAKPAGRADGAKPANRSSGSSRRRPSEEY